MLVSGYREGAKGGGGYKPRCLVLEISGMMHSLPLLIPSSRREKSQLGREKRGEGNGNRMRIEKEVRGRKRITIERINDYYT